MKFKFVSPIVVIGILAAFQTIASAQLFSNKSLSREDKSEFQVSANVGLGFSGFSTQADYSLADELGVKYDVMSLLRDAEVKQKVGISKEQYEEISEISNRVAGQIDKMILNGAVIDDRTAEIESVFRDLQGELQAVMDSEQVALLELARHQIGIKKRGFAKYLSTVALREKIGLSAEQVKQLQSVDSQFNKNFLDKSRELSKQANLELIARLPEDRRSQFEELLNDEERAEFIVANLFTKTKSLRGKPARNFSVLVGMTRSKQVRKEIDLTGSAAEAIKLLKRKIKKLDDDQIEESVTELLTSDQIDQLSLMTIAKQIPILGTANSLCYGMLAHAIGLTDEEADQLYESSETIGKELKADLHDAKMETLQAGLSKLSPEQVQQVCEIVGDLNLATLKR